MLTDPTEQVTANAVQLAQSSMLDLRPLGQTGLLVSSLCIGTSPLGGMPEVYGHEVEADVALQALDRVFRSDIRFLDTSNGYSNGESERRVGKAIANHGGLPDGFVLATKADPLPGSRDFSGARVRKSLEESLERLGMDQFDVYHLHDPEFYDFDTLTAPGGAVDTLLTLKAEGVVKHLGVAGGDVHVMRRYLETGAFEIVLNHNNFTLVDRSAEPLMDYAKETGVAFVNAAPFGGGILAKGPGVGSKYRYAAADAPLVARIEGIRALCDEFDIPLGALALQFSLRDARIASTVVGISRRERVDQLLEYAAIDIPTELWDRTLLL